MPKTGQRSTAAQQRENYKRGIIGIKAALELDADPTYINDDSHDSGPCNDVFEYKFYLTNPSLPLYSIQTPISAPLTSLGVDWGPGPASRPPLGSVVGPQLANAGAPTYIKADADLQPDWEDREVSNLLSRLNSRV